MTQNNMTGFKTNQIGWRGKVANKLQEILIKDDDWIISFFKNPLYEKPLSKSVINHLLKNKDDLLTNLRTDNELWQTQGIGKKSWENIFMILRDEIKSDVDVVVSYDLHRLIRMEGSIHGKSGFKKIPVKYDDLKHFDPLNEALSFPLHNQNLLKIKIVSKIAPEIRIGDDVYGPFQNGEKITLPINAALFFLCKGVASLIQN